jgi:hypothetical protein
LPVPNAPDFRRIRSWEGSQANAFEQLAYQLRPAAPDGARTVKTGNPDAGFDWYWELSSGEEIGRQAKYIFDIDVLFAKMRESIVSVASKRPQATAIIFQIPIDLPEDISPPRRTSARQRFVDNVARWKKSIPGASGLRIDVETQATLLERLGNEDQRGRQWFWWSDEIFSLDWCREQLRISIEAAGPRYTSDFNVVLPVTFALDGLASTPTFWKQYRLLRGRMAKAAYKVSSIGGQVVDADVDDARASADALIQLAARDGWPPPGRLPLIDLRAATGAVVESVSQALWKCNELLEHRADTGAENQADAARSPQERLKWLVGDLDRLLDRTQAFEAFLDSPATGAAASGAMFMSGRAGQGKTHLFCRFVSDQLERGRPAIVVAGEALNPLDFWASLSARLGLSTQGWEVLVGAMVAAAEACGERFVLLVDALNDSVPASAWRGHLPVIRASTAANGWVGLGVSCRDTFVDVVAPPDSQWDGFARVEHPGLAGREVEGIPEFFAYYGVTPPAGPRLISEFSNPLFLKLYCLGLRGYVGPTPEHGLSAVFERFVDAQARRIESDLDLDRPGQPVRKAINALADELIRTQKSFIVRERAAELVNAFAPDRAGWSNSLFAHMLGGALLAGDRFFDGSEMVDGVAFSYQRFSDHLVVEAMLSGLETGVDGTLPIGTLADLATHAPPNWVEALSIQVPERFGVELIDVIRGRLTDGHPWTLARWLRPFVHSLPWRSAASITDRVRDLLEEADSAGLRPEVLDALVGMATETHATNGMYLHQLLSRLSMPERDAFWGIETYDALGQSGSLDRLLRWALNGSVGDLSTDLLELSCIPLAWSLSSPNRRLRDLSTKALVELTRERLEVIQSLLTRFADVNDPYVRERLVLAAYGAVVRGGSVQPQERSALILWVHGHVFGGASVPPHARLRDAARAIVEFGVAEGLVESSLLKDARPPYASRRPAVPPSKATLEARYPTGPVGESSYSTLWHSIFYDDFRHYVIEPLANSFTQLSIGTPPPAARPAEEPEIRPAAMERFIQGLSAEQRELVANGDWPKLFGHLTKDQSKLSMNLWRERKPIRPDPRMRYPTKRAERWIFAECVRLGWAPELFARFDRWRPRHGRDSHKPERFGKKYQWIAFDELMARLSDSFAMSGRMGEVEYEGPGQFYRRDIDPSLPVGRLAVDGEGADAPFPPATQSSWWNPPAPHEFPARASLIDWVSAQPSVDVLAHLLRVDNSDVEWIVLDSSFTWRQERPEDEPEFNGESARIWIAVGTWLVKEDQQRAASSWLRSTKRANGQAPDPPNVSQVYLGEIPSALSLPDSPEGWFDEWGNSGAPVPLIPTSIAYSWEGSGYDLSLDDSVNINVPTATLWKHTHLRWTGLAPAWVDDGQLVAQHLSLDDGQCSGSALLVRKNWLDQVLVRAGLQILGRVGGELRVVHHDLAGRNTYPWREIEGFASLGKIPRVIATTYELRRPRSEAHWSSRTR